MDRYTWQWRNGTNVDSDNVRRSPEIEICDRGEQIAIVRSTNIANRVVDALNAGEAQPR